MTNKKPMRQAMPTVAGWIDGLRAAFGAEMIDAAIRAGIDGQPTFYAAENGIEIGTRSQHGSAEAAGTARKAKNTKGPNRG